MSLAVGIDIGGTGIKGAVVDSETGELQSERFKLETPRGGKPDDIADVVGEVYAELNQPGPVGICLPSVVKNGVSKSAANISKEWIDYPAKDKFEQHLQTPVVVVNDADAAGLAEVRFGASTRRGFTGGPRPTRWARRRTELRSRSTRSPRRSSSSAASMPAG